VRTKLIIHLFDAVNIAILVYKLSQTLRYFGFLRAIHILMAYAYKFFFGDGTLRFHYTDQMSSFYFFILACVKPHIFVILV
jgi:hypothetical protein